VAQHLGFTEMASGASGVLVYLASTPSGADSFICKVFSGTIIWSANAGSVTLSATAAIGLPLSGADPAFLVGDGKNPIASFGFRPMGGGAVVAIGYTHLEGRTFNL
jgi:hypothetical protein